MTESAYIPPSERELLKSARMVVSRHSPLRDEISIWRQRLSTVADSHAVMDSIAADQHDALRLAARFIMGRSNGNLVTESQAIGWLTGTDVLARYDETIGGHQASSLTVTREVDE